MSPTPVPRALLGNFPNIHGLGETVNHHALPTSTLPREGKKIQARLIGFFLGPHPSTRRKGGWDKGGADTVVVSRRDCPVVLLSPYLELPRLLVPHPSLPFRIQCILISFLPAKAGFRCLHQQTLMSSVNTPRRCFPDFWKLYWYIKKKITISHLCWQYRRVWAWKSMVQILQV